MTIGEVTPYIGILAFGLSVIGVIRNEQLRRQGSVEQTRKALELIEHRVNIVELRLLPLFKVMDERLSAMFHQPDPEAYELDALIEKYEADRSDLKDSLSDRELNRLITLVHAKYEASKKDGATPDPFEEFRASFWLALLDGLKNVRLLEQQQSSREQEHRETLLGYLRDAHQAQDQRGSWWARLLSSLRGSSSR